MVSQSRLPNHLGSAVFACTLMRKVPSDIAKMIMNSLKSKLNILMQEQSIFFTIFLLPTKNPLQTIKSVLGHLVLIQNILFAIDSRINVTDIK